MEIISDIPEIRAALRELRQQGNVGPQGSVGLVPTMGALHDGHLSLVRASRSRCGVTVVSIFVNPTQFGPQEDFSRYPRTLDEDCRVLESEGVDIVFTPSVETMYPPGASTFVEVGEIGDRLDGASRPGHFRGVATVAAKLFDIVQPQFAFFGQKDSAQVAVLRRMVRDLDFPVELVACPIVRELDGLAMSSRNRYLSATERVQALCLRRALEAAERLIAGGEYRAIALVDAVTEALRLVDGLRVDYVAVVDPDTLLPIEDARAGALLAVAASVGGTRLIDNSVLAPVP